MKTTVLLPMAAVLFASVYGAPIPLSTDIAVHYTFLLAEVLLIGAVWGC